MYNVYSLIFTGYCGKSLERICKVFLKKYNSTGIIHLPKNNQKFIVIKSPHVYKKSREQFESVIYKKMINIYINNSEDTLFSNILKGVSWSVFGISIKKVKIYKNSFYI